MSSSQALKTLLTLKRAAEESAAAALASQQARRAAAEATLGRLKAEAEQGRDHLRQRRAAEAPRGPETAARALEREHFWGRLAEEVALRTDRARAHRDGELAQAVAGVATALTSYRVAREAREVVETLVDKAEAANRQLQARRDEAVRDEQASRPRGPR